MSTTSIRAVLADDERLMREQLRARLTEVWPELDIVAEAKNGLEAVELVQQHKPDLVVRAFFGDRRYRQDRWSPAQRPALQAALRGVPTVSLDARSVGCGTAHTIDALRKLKAAM